jgi:hypothetical protein
MRFGVAAAAFAAVATLIGIAMPASLEAQEQATLSTDLVTLGNDANQWPMAARNHNATRCSALDRVWSGQAPVPAPQGQ